MNRVLVTIICLTFTSLGEAQTHFQQKGIAGTDGVKFDVNADCTAQGAVIFQIGYDLPKDKAEYDLLSLTAGIPLIPLSKDDAPFVNKLFSLKDKNNREIQLVFEQRDPKQEFRKSMNMSRPNILQQGIDLSKAVASQEGAADYTIRAIDLFEAQTIRLKFTLANGNEPVVTIRPQDPAFKSFAASCTAAFPLYMGDLGEPQDIYSPGARFVPLSREEIAAIQREFWLGRAGQVADFATRFRKPEVAPANTQFAPIQMRAPDNVERSVGVSPGESGKVSIPVGQGLVDLVRLQDGRVGLIATESYNDPSQDPLFKGRWTPLPSKGEVFEGTAEEFAVALPEYLRRAGLSVSHVEEAMYKKEEAYLINLVRSCAAVTPEMVQSAVINHHGDLSRLDNGRYADCIKIGGDVTTMAGAGSTKEKRDLYLIGPENLRLAPDGKTIRIDIIFGSLPSDYVGHTGTNSVLYERRLAVEAIIQSESVAK